MKFVVDAPPFIENNPLVIVDDAFERKPLVNVARPVCRSVPVCVVSPRTEREPSCAVCAKRFVELAVVEKKLVEVAFESVVLPVTLRVPAVARLPAESIVVEAV